GPDCVGCAAPPALVQIALAHWWATVPATAAAKSASSSAAMAALVVKPRAYKASMIENCRLAAFADPAGTSPAVTAASSLIVAPAAVSHAPAAWSLGKTAAIAVCAAASPAELVPKVNAPVAL